MRDQITVVTYLTPLHISYDLLQFVYDVVQRRTIFRVKLLASPCQINYSSDANTLPQTSQQRPDGKGLTGVSISCFILQDLWGYVGKGFVVSVVILRIERVIWFVDDFSFRYLYRKAEIDDFGSPHFAHFMDDYVLGVNIAMEITSPLLGTKSLSHIN